MNTEAIRLIENELNSLQSTTKWTEKSFDQIYRQLAQKKLEYGECLLKMRELLETLKALKSTKEKE